jgi:hypothetical protein
MLEMEDGFLRCAYLSYSTGLHLAPKGYRVLYDEFRNVLSREWPELLPENLPYVYPIWDRFAEEWKSGPQTR